MSKAEPEDLEELSAALLEVQRETSRRNAARIRSYADTIREADWLADQIDPEVPNV
ncbi:hypothetical protein OTB20_08490 [Streptomyces sp. H27-H1]|uniref:hypothetical protein n=1 Tax=Streptomyces sp. H27-H1 TaxID=2996461 RepID=UPI0022704E56|nr:hypothetical protein [Streptomyces sp. H27-H1]MCY0926243.1 hypothetical protein [Streptomyces sp. H27-H1]